LENRAEQRDQLPEQLQARREIEVLAGLLQHPAQCAQVLKWLPPRAFTPGPHREIYEALRAVARTGAPVDALTVAWQLCMRQAAEDTTGFGERPSSNSPEPAAAETVFRLAEIPVDPSSAFLAGSLRLADHVSANMPPDQPSASASAKQGADPAAQEAFLSR
jgi:DnaB-like helicase N terminal domain